MDELEEEFLDLYEAVEESLLDEFDMLAGTDDPAEKAVYFNAIIATLAFLIIETQRWGARSLTTVFNDAVNSALSKIGPGARGVSETALDAVGSFQIQLVDAATRARESIAQEALKLYAASSVTTAYPDLANKARIQLEMEQKGETDVAGKTRGLLVDQLEKGMVAVTASNRKTYRFSLRDYANMVITALRNKVAAEGTKAAAAANTWDLVRISNNPSMHGDWCELYRGKVYSISGNHPVFPPLSSLPNGGAPFHPHCRHYIEVFSQEGFTAKELQEMITDNRWLMQPDDVGPNRIIRAYWRSRRK